MKVFKFGGASVQNIERIQQVANIIKENGQEPLMVIVSAMGKTTNYLEKVVDAFYNNNQSEALALFNQVKQQHLTIAKYILIKQYNNCYNKLNDFFTEVEWLLHDKPVRTYDYYYDQIVCIGELLSTTIISYYLLEENIQNTWLDVRDIIRTDNTFREATIDWNYASKARLLLDFSKCNVFVTQGFIGATDDNESTTLGREGSDYSAAVFANILNAESLTIFKDVEGVMNADPKAFKEAVILKELSFNEVIEMAYYGAQVIHPKTIKPLQNKGIPLHVKCFLDTSLPGTTIHTKRIKNLPPIFVIKQQQVLVNLFSKDFSFVGEQPIIGLYNLLVKLKIKANLLQTGAISVQLCIDDNPEKIDLLATEAAILFDVQLEKNLELLTIRHYNSNAIETLTSSKQMVLQQQTIDTFQMLYRK